MIKKRLFLASLLVSAMMLVVGCDDKDDDATVDAGSRWVDLGLPSGLLWATSNIGASSPYEYGDYYAWGETEPKQAYSADNYKYSEDGGYTKYCTMSDRGYNGFVDNLTTLQPSDDVATVVLGSDARMPMSDEWEELVANCTWMWENVDGVSGYSVKGRNGNTIFLPAAGNRYGDELYYQGVNGYYWSSSLSSDGPYDAWGLSFDTDEAGEGDDFRRYIGMPVRAVSSTR